MTMNASQIRRFLYPNKAMLSLNTSVVYKYSSLAAGNNNNPTRKCPFLSKKIKTTSSMNMCPIIDTNQTIFKYDKMLYSSNISQHSLYPKRDGLDENEFEGGIKWRGGEPVDYTIQNETYLRERKGKWTDPNSLENIASNLIKTLEMEITNKLDPNQWVSMVPEVFNYKANNGTAVATKEALDKGTYNILLQDADPTLYDKTMSFEQSHETFFKAFPKGFVWELLKIYSGPPKVSFTWRHWGKFDGSFNNYKGNGQEINVYGFGSANLQMPDDQNQRIRIKDFKVYYDLDKFLSDLNGTEYTATQDAAFGELA